MSSSLKGGLASKDPAIGLKSSSGLQKVNNKCFKKNYKYIWGWKWCQNEVIDLTSVSDTRKHLWQIIYHFIAFFKLNLGIILLFALIKPAACISQMKISFKLEVVLSWLEVVFTIKSKITLVQRSLNYRMS